MIIDKETVQLIKDRASIVDVVGKYVHLIKAGNNYKGLCPFHNERTPSFSVNVRKNYCYCFSCHKGGNPVNFLMEKEGYSFHEALRELAKMYGIQIPEQEMNEEERERLSRRDLMLAINKWAMGVMEANLRTEEGVSIALQYLYHRHVTEEAIKAFHLGYIPERSKEFTDTISGRGYDPEVLMELGLVGKSERDGNYYDKMRGRVIFPILSEGGRVVGFGARTMRKEDKAKYVNSPANAIYSKKEELYGFVQAKESIREKKKVYLVEGYMDVIGMWQTGIRNVVAACGTSFTEEQALLIKRHTENITLIFDNDNAGRRAAEKSMRLLLKIGLTPKILILPDGHDPDSFARENSPEGVEKYVDENETDFLTYLVRNYIEEHKSDPVAVGNGMKQIVNVLAYISSGLSREIYVRECARLTGFSEETVLQATLDARKDVERELAFESEMRQKEKDREEREERQEKERRDKSEVQGTSGEESDENVDNGLRPDDSRSNSTKTDFWRRTSANANYTPTSSYPGDTREDNNLFREERNLFLRERVLCEYLVKYGLLVAGVYEDENGEKFEINVWEYVRSQIENDGTGFSDPLCRRVYDKLQDIMSDYEPHWQSYSETIEKKIEEMRKEGFDAIAEKNPDMETIRAEEERLEYTLSRERDNLKQQYERNYIENLLSYDEDDNIRKFVSSIVIERHQLSNLYLKNGNAENDEDRLSSIVPRAIFEWKSELLTLRHKELMERFKAIDPTDEESVRIIQQELSAILDMRSEIAKNIGDRIIAPRR